MEHDSLWRTDKELADLYQRHVDQVYRLCCLYLKNPVDAEDAVQSVFLKLIRSRTDFNDFEHEKAWLIVAARNHCKDQLKHWWKSRRADMDSLPETYSRNDGEPSGEVLARLLSLPEKYKTALYLYYYEDYSVKEIAEMLGRKESTVLTRLSRGRERLKIDLGRDSLER